MSTTIVFLFLASSSLFILSYAQSQHLEENTGEEAFISIRLSYGTYNFIKSMIIRKALGSITPIELPKIEETAQIPFMGEAEMILPPISITQISDLCVCNQTSFELVAWGSVCNLTINCNYPFLNWIVGNQCVAIQVDGMQLGHTLDLQIYNGKLKLSLIDYVHTEKHVSVKSNVEKGSNWLFQRMIYAFERQIGDLLQNVISEKFKERIVKLDSFIQALPSEIPIDESASLNVTLLKGVSIDKSYIFDIDGSFITRNRTPVPANSFRNPKPPVFCSKKSKQIEISVDEHVFNSASALYFDAKYMQWIVDEIPDGNLQNTAGWSSVLPQLHKQYPNCEVKLKIYLTSPPVIRISEQKIDATANAELIVNVLKADQLIPVACFCLKMNGSVRVGMIEDHDEYRRLRVVGNVTLNDLSVSLGWSHIDNLDDHLYLIQSLVERVLLACADAKLRQGFYMPPGFRGFDLWKAEIILSDSKVTLCADFSYSELQ